MVTEGESKPFEGTLSNIERLLSMFTEARDCIHTGKPANLRLARTTLAAAREWSRETVLTFTEDEKTMKAVAKAAREAQAKTVKGG